MADVLEKFCGPNNCDTSSRGTSDKYVVVSGNSDFIVFPLAQLINRASSNDKIMIADRLARAPLPNNQLRVFLIKNGRVIESVRGVIGVRLASTQ